MIQLARRNRRKTLTNRMVAALPKKAKRYVMPDPELRGHYVRVMPKGANVFAAVARDPYGKQVWATIGSADVLSIEEARDNTRAAIKRIKEGKPAFEPPPVRPDAFRAVAEGWLKRHVAAKKLRSQAEIERVLAKYVYPHWAFRDFGSLRRSDIAQLLDHVEDNHGKRQADVVLAIVRSISNWFASRNDNYLSPFTRGMRRADPKAGKRARVLDDDELRRVWKVAEANGTFGAIIRMLLLTAQRRDKVVGMRWADIAGGVWRIPVEEREKGHAGDLLLPAPALEILKAQPRLASNPHVFAGRSDGPINGFSKPKAVFDQACGVADWTLHDLRRTARSLMSRAGVTSEHAERVLGHAIAGIEGTYNRHHYFDEKADALRRLTALIERIVSDEPRGTVLPLRAPTGQS